MDIKHHMMYAKEHRIPKDSVLRQHKHTVDHYSWLKSGSAKVRSGDKDRYYAAPAMIFIPANESHMVTALTDIEWWCMFETDERDASVIETTLIAEAA